MLDCFQYRRPWLVALAALRGHPRTHERGCRQEAGGRVRMPSISHPAPCPSPPCGERSRERPGQSIRAYECLGAWSHARESPTVPDSTRQRFGLRPLPSGLALAGSIEELCGVESAESVARQGLRHPTPHNSGLHIDTCDTIRNFRTVSGASRLAPVPWVPVSFLASLSNQGPFPPQALPRFPGTTGLSATLPARTGPHGFSVGACAPPTGLPVLHPLPCACMLSPLPRRRRPAIFVRAPLDGTGRWQPSP